MNLRPILSLMAVAVLAAACASPAAPSANPPSVQSPGPSQSAAAGTITLRVAPADLGCDAMPVEYRRVTFQIDPAAEEPVVAQSDTGKSLPTFWSAGFAGSAEALAVTDPSGQVVAADGETLEIAEGALPRLHGYFVCPSTDALYVLLQDPS